jgi:histidyl-tRNA synthetase
MAEKIQRPRGTEDVLPPRSEAYRWIERTFTEVLEAFGFGEIRIPIFERTELFARGIGAYTDIVSKEMYTFEDRGGRNITLRPEGTAGVVRAYIENGLHAKGGASRFYYLGPMFRYERPQAGRLRQHTQVGAEIFGSPEPTADAELIIMILQAFEKLGLSDLEVLINSVGCAECRPAYYERLQAFLEDLGDALCEDCRTRRERNPMRVFDCKNPDCKEALSGAPYPADFLCEGCRKHFDQVVVCLEAAGVEPAKDASLVRGLDYYTRTVFEIRSEALGAKDTVCAGGRYDNLVEEIGGPPTPALGFGCGIERLYLLLEARGLLPESAVGYDLYCACLGEEAVRICFPLAQKLRERGIQVLLPYESRGFKSHFKQASRLGARYVLVCGENELRHKVFAVKRMSDGEQHDVPADIVRSWQSLQDLEGVFTS